MRFDRILAGILAYINSLLWWRKAEIPAAPYTRLQEWRFERRGMLYLIQRSQELCPRDVGTFFFVPFRSGQNQQQDIHLCCDHLEGMAGVGNSTHRITIMRASHWPGPDGLYDAEELFQADYDLQGQQTRRDIYVRCILQRVAFQLEPLNAESIDWGWEIEQAKKECMGTDYTLKRRLPGQAIALPYDPGTRPIKIRY
ncbi:MAG: hypothetical protein F6K42_15450 [Leptolyngbya sp. SIO1D8]|nr:hypothetical protein [Leptolyngbya sp. SIO1D8]